LRENIVKNLELPLEERWKYACEAMWGTWVGSSVNYAEEFGWDKANEKVVHRTDVEGASDASYALDKLNIIERDATAALRAGLFLIVNLYPGHGTKIIDYTKERASAEWSSCTQFNIAKNLKIEEKYDMPKLCETWWKRVAKTVNPSLDAKLEEMLCAKANKCKVIVWKK
jgi:hypothetical protein